MKPLAILAAAALALLWAARRRQASCQQVNADDSDVVGMPTTWGTIPDRVTLTGSFGTDGTLGNSWTLGPGWYVEFAPTSRN